MENYLVLGLTTASAILFAVYLYQRQKGGSSSNIPGPKPVIKSEGNFPDIVKSGGFTRFLQDIHNKYGAIASFWWGPQLMVSLSSPELFKYQARDFNRALQLFEQFKSILGFKAISFVNGEEGKRRHKAYKACFNTKNIKQHFEMLNKLTDNMIDQWRKLKTGYHINIKKYLLYHTAKASLQSVMGAFFEDDQKVAEFNHSSLQMWDTAQRRLSGDNPIEDSEEVKAFDKHRSIVRSIVDEACTYRLDHPAGDGERLLVDIIMDQDIDEDIKTDDINDMFFSATHTTGYVTVWAIYFLAKNYQIQEKAHRELQQVIGDNKITPETLHDLGYLEQVINETLRWTSMVPFTVRYKDTDCKIQGYHIPAKTPIVHAIGVLNKDPTYFPEPEKFDPERFSPENMKKLPVLTFEPFGFAGKRKCPAYRFAMLEATIVIAEILKAYKISLVKGQAVTRVDGLVTKPSEDILITIDQRH